jgi:hypothetical protein
MHAAGVKLDHPVFVGMSSQSDAFVIGVILRTCHNLEGGIEGVASASEEGVCAIEIVVAVGSADNDRQFSPF